MALSIDPISSPRIITILSPITFISVQELVDQIRDWEDATENMEYPHLVEASGKDDLGGGTAVGITMKLQNARVAFEARPGPAYVQCTIAGGNTVALDGVGAVMDPIHVTAFTQVVLSQSSSPTIVNTDILKQVTKLQYMIESQRPTHKGYGGTCFVDPVNGDDLNDGSSPDQALRTIMACLAMAQSGRGDVMYIMAPNTGSVIITENVVMDKEDIHIRGPGGHGVTIQPASGVPVTINANHCSLTGLAVMAPVGSSSDCIVVNGKSAKLSWMYVVGAGKGVGTGRGVVFRGGDYSRVTNCEIEKCGSSGLLLIDAGLTSGAPRELTCKETAFYLNGGDGATLTSVAGAPYASTRLNRFINCNFYNNALYGLSIDANSCGTLIDVGHLYANTSGMYLDDGIDTHMGLMPNDVWAFTTDKAVVGSMAKRVNDINAKTTILLGK